MTNSSFIQTVGFSCLGKAIKSSQWGLNWFLPCIKYFLYITWMRVCVFAILTSCRTIDIVKSVGALITKAAHTQFIKLRSFQPANNWLIFVNSLGQPPVIPLFKGQQEWNASFLGTKFGRLEFAFGNNHCHILTNDIVKVKLKGEPYVRIRKEKEASRTKTITIKKTGSQFFG